jgi:hypothetical protein
LALEKKIRTGNTGNECQQRDLIGRDAESDKNICDRFKVPDEPWTECSNIHNLIHAYASH